MICPYGHQKEIARYCHTCKRQAAKQQYDDKNGAELRRERRNSVSGQRVARKRLSTNDERNRMSLLDQAPSNGCEHHLAYEIADDRVMCYGCGAEWPLIKTEEAIAPPAAKRKGRAKKTAPEVGQEETGLQQAIDTDAVRGADVQTDGEPDAESESELHLPVQNAQPAPSDVQETRRRGKKAKPPVEPTDQDGPEYTDAGPMNGFKCPAKGCVTKLEPHFPNIFTNGTKTFHYGCPNCETRVTVYLPDGV